MTIEINFVFIKLKPSCLRCFLLLLLRNSVLAKQGGRANNTQIKWAAEQPSISYSPIHYASSEKKNLTYYVVAQNGPK